MLENYWCINLDIKYTQVFLSNTIQYWLFNSVFSTKTKTSRFL